MLFSELLAEAQAFSGNSEFEDDVCLVAVEAGPGRLQMAGYQAAACTHGRRGVEPGRDRSDHVFFAAAENYGDLDTLEVVSMGEFNGFLGVLEVARLEFIPAPGFLGADVEQCPCMLQQYFHNLISNSRSLRESTDAILPQKLRQHTSDRRWFTDRETTGIGTGGRRGFFQNQHWRWFDALQGR